MSLQVEKLEKNMAKLTIEVGAVIPGLEEKLVGAEIRSEECGVG